MTGTDGLATQKGVNLILLLVLLLRKGFGIGLLKWRVMWFEGGDGNRKTVMLAGAATITTNYEESTMMK